MGANEKHDATYHCGEYTPDTTRVRHSYVEHVDYTAQLHGMDSDGKYAGEAFDRWLETVRAEAKVEALEEAAGEPELMRGSTAYVSTEWLRARANQYK